MKQSTDVESADESGVAVIGVDEAIVDVAIVGGGMVGAALACALGGSNLKVVVIEPAGRTASDYYANVVEQNKQGFDSRVSALTAASEQMLRNLGAWPLIKALRACPYTDMKVWDGEGTSSIGFQAAEIYAPQLGHIVENRVILAGLYQTLNQYDNIQLLSGCSIKQLSPSQLVGHSSTQVATSQAARCYRQIELSNGDVLNARLVVAADGARSATRKLAGLPINEWDYQHHAIVTTVTVEHSHQSTAWQRFTEDGPLAFLPLPSDASEPHRCSIVWSTSPDHARELMALDDAAFNRALSRDFEYRLGAVLKSDERHCFPLLQRHASQYVAESVALVGDAAHTIHPLAGQGVNLGFLDAATLAEEVLHAQQQQVDFSQLSWLRRYQRRRQSENMQLMGVMAGFKHLYAEVPPSLHWLRNAGMRCVDSMAPLKQMIARRAMGMGRTEPELMTNNQQSK